MFIEERHKSILAALQLKMRMSLPDLQALVNASSATVRRDLELLEQQGRIVRVRGGAMHPDYLGAEPTFTEKSNEAVVEKAHIAVHAAGLITPGASVFIDAGTTCLEVGRRLLQRKDLTLFTNSIPLASLGGNGGARMICIGGEVRDVSRALVGALSLNWLRHVHFDFAILGASGLSSKDGAMTTELSEAAIKQQLFQRSAVSILAADSGKWNKFHSTCFAPWPEFRYWVTDSSIPPEAVEAVQRHGVEVELAPSL